MFSFLNITEPEGLSDAASHKGRAEGVRQELKTQRGQFQLHNISLVRVQ